LTYFIPLDDLGYAYQDIRDIASRVKVIHNLSTKRPITLKARNPRLRKDLRKKWKYIVQRYWRSHRFRV